VTAATGGREPGPGPGPWRGALGELLIAAVAVAATAAAGCALAGPQALVIVATGTAVAALLVARLLPPTEPEQDDVDGGMDSVRGSWSSFRYWRYLSDLRDGIEARGSYEARLRPALEHLFAARLAERHDVNLYTDPAAARRVLCRSPREEDLWAWIDPAAEPPDTGAKPRDSRQPPGIPRRTLERLIERLEQL